MASVPVQKRARFELEFSSAETSVTTVYRFTRDFFRVIVGDGVDAERLALTLYELLENAVRYSSDDYACVRASALPSDRGTMLVVETVNRADEQRLAEARRWLDRIERSEDPSQLYQDLMLESLRREEGSGLGLARVRCEAEMKLRFEINGSELIVRAELDAPREKSG